MTKMSSIGFIYFAQESNHLSIPYGRRRAVIIQAALGRPTPDGLIKIGFTDMHPTQRLLQIATRIGRTLTIVGVLDGTRRDERALLHKFAPLETLFPWGTEWFLPSENLLALIEGLPRIYDERPFVTDGHPRSRGESRWLIRARC